MSFVSCKLLCASFKYELPVTQQKRLTSHELDEDGRKNRSCVCEQKWILELEKSVQLTDTVSQPIFIYLLRSDFYIVYTNSLILRTWFSTAKKKTLHLFNVTK